MQHAVIIANDTGDDDYERIVRGVMRICPRAMLTSTTDYLVEFVSICTSDSGIALLPYPELGVNGNPYLFFQAVSIVMSEFKKVQREYMNEQQKGAGKK